MKVAIITFHYPDNFGAAWQAYSLCAALEQLGHDPFLIDYRPPDQLPAYKMPIGRFILTPRMIGFLKRKAEFEAFRKHHFPAKTELYRSLAELKKKPPIADAYIAGSDQIWNRDLLDGQYDPAYFLEFARSGRRVSYAASFGETSELLPSDELRGHLSRLDVVSVREIEAVRVLTRAFNIDIATVCDPVFLINSYKSFLGIRPVKADFVFTYNLFGRQSMDELSMKLGRAVNCEVRRVNDDWKLWKYPSKAEFGISPIRWLNLINSSKLVLSDSFHATVFSILLKKNFLTVLANSQNKKANRIVNLLEQLQLQDRIVTADESIDVIMEKNSRSIDWEAVHRRIDEFRRVGNQYLVNALAG